MKSCVTAADAANAANVEDSALETERAPEASSTHAPTGFRTGGGDVELKEGKQRYGHGV